jgi:hypothetical protein
MKLDKKPAYSIKSTVKILELAFPEYFEVEANRQ